MPDARAQRGAPDSFDFEGGGDDARDWLESAYGTSLGLRGRMGTVSHRRLDGDGVAFDHLRIGSPLTFDADAMPVLVVVDVLEGEIEYSRERVTDRGHDGDTLLAAGWGRPFTGGGTGYEVRNTSVSVDVLAEAIGEIDPDRTPDDLRFTGFVPRTPAAGARWRATVDELTASFPSRDEPVAHGEAARLLGHTLLHTFANNIVTSTGTDARDSRDATQGAVRRAQSVIQERGHDDLSLADLARECHVTPRTLQYAFRRHLGCTPAAYLKQFRLDLAHQALREGTSSVGEVAGRFGFFNPGRFATDYRQVFGENPGHTLAHVTS